MTPALLRTLLTFALVMALGVTTNVFFLQGVTSSPEGATRLAHQPELARGPAAAETDARQDQHRVILATQRELHVRGYLQNAANGDADLLTRAAILAYETDHGLPLSATPSDALLKSIIMGNPYSGAAQTGVPSEAAQVIIRRIQRALARLGYGDDRETGQLDQATRKAIRAFENARGLQQSGRISAALVHHLGPALETQQGDADTEADDEPDAG